MYVCIGSRWGMYIVQMVLLDDAAMLSYIMQSTTAIYVCNALSTCTYIHSLNIIICMYVCSVWNVIH